MLMGLASNNGDVDIEWIQYTTGVACQSQLMKDFII